MTLSGVPTSWAMPCFPITGKQMGVYMLPQIGAGVWVEFEQGNRILVTSALRRRLKPVGW